MKQTESIKNIGAALLVFHKEVGTVSKDRTNPFFKSKYAGLPEVLEAIKEPLEKAGLSFMQFPKGQNELETIIIHSESGEWMSESFYMKPTKEDPQAYGSVITYQRRYALGAILGLSIDEDDDAITASVKVKNEPKPELKKGTDMWKSALTYLSVEGNSIDNIKAKYTLSKENEALLLKEGK